MSLESRVLRYWSKSSSFTTLGNGGGKQFVALIKGERTEGQVCTTVRDWVA